MKTKEGKKPTAEELGHMLIDIYESGYLSKKEAYKISFFKGIAGGFGGVIGATIVVALLLWTMSLFHKVPLLGPFVDRARNTVQQQE